MKLSKTRSDSARITADFIKDGKIVIIPTDTIYGFSARVGTATDSKIRALKGRGETKPFIELIANPSDVYAYTDEIPKAVFDLWPAPLTVIVTKKASLGGGTVALRCPDDDWLRTVISLCNTSVYSTSVNRSGEKPLSSIGAIEEAFGDCVPLIVDAGELNGSASTLVDVTGGTIRILRQGSVVL